jgi:hypothetical protein
VDGAPSCPSEPRSFNDGDDEDRAESRKPPKGDKITVSYPIGDIDLKRALTLKPAGKFEPFEGDCVITNGRVRWRIGEPVLSRLRWGRTPTPNPTLT